MYVFKNGATDISLSFGVSFFGEIYSSERRVVHNYYDSLYTVCYYVYAGTKIFCIITFPNMFGMGELDVSTKQK